MASLREIASANAKEIRDGIAWVIVWKTGRSWHAVPVWLDSDTDKLSSEDDEMVREILKQDPDAVMINGYYSGHLGKSMTLKELEDGICWYYEKGTRLITSTIFEQESEEQQRNPDVLVQAVGRCLPKRPWIYKTRNKDLQSTGYGFCILSKKISRKQAIHGREPPENQNIIGRRTSCENRE